jgi:hypothetical protein
LNVSQNSFIANTSPVIASDGTIYIGYNELNSSLIATQGYLFSFNSNGSIKWQYQLNITDKFYQSTPTIDSTGTIYFGSQQGYVYAINYNGTLKWVHQFVTNYGVFTPVGNITESLIIGNDNNIYFGSNSDYTSNNSTTYLASFFSIKSIDGSQNWNYKLTNATISESCAIDNNNNIYVVYQQPNNSQLVYLLSLKSDGTLNYISDINNYIQNYEVANLILSRPTLNVNNSMVYVLTNVSIESGGSGFYIYLNSINTQDGTKSSIQIPIGSISGATSIARDTNNNVYFLVRDIDRSGALYSIKNNSINWKYTITAPDGGAVFVDNTPAIGSDGTIYFAAPETDSLSYQNCYMYAINSNGTLKWKKLLPGGYL